MYNLKTGFLTFILVLAGCGTAPDKAVIALPMQLAGGAPVIELTIDGQGPYSFILDTGASMGVILPNLVDELRLVGQPDSHQTVVLENVMAGALALGDLEVGIIEFPLPEPVRGVMSMAMFADYLVNLDYPAKQLTLTKGELQAELMQRYADGIEAHVRAHPDHLSRV